MSFLSSETSFGDPVGGNKKKISLTRCWHSCVRNCFHPKGDVKNSNAFRVLTPVSYTHLLDLSNESDTSRRNNPTSQNTNLPGAQKVGSAKVEPELLASCKTIEDIHNLGVRYLHGQGIPQSFGRAHTCFMICLSKGLAASMSQLGYMYLYGKGVTRDVRRARSWYKKAAETDGDPYALYCLAAISFEGYGTSVNLPRGREYLLSSAEQNYSMAVYNLAACYSEGISGFPCNKKFAAQLYKRLATSGDTLSQNNLGVLLIQGSHDVEPNPKLAILLFKVAAQTGLSQASYNLGLAYSNGIGLRQNLYKASRSFYKAAQQARNSDAECMLGHIFLNGDGVKSSMDDSIYWFNRAASHGSVAARNNLMILQRQATSNPSSLNSRPESTSLRQSDDTFFLSTVI